MKLRCVQPPQKIVNLSQGRILSRNVSLQSHSRNSKFVLSPFPELTWKRIVCCRGAKIAKMPSELITVSLNRESGSDEPWGFEITGGKDVDEQLAISHVRKTKLHLLLGIFFVNYAVWEFFFWHCSYFRLNQKGRQGYSFPCERSE